MLSIMGKNLLPLREEHLHCGLIGRLSEELCDYRRSNKILSMDWKERAPRV